MDGKAIHERLTGKFGERITAAALDGTNPFAVVATNALLDVASFCKNDPELAFDNLMCHAAVDFPKETPPRIEVVYVLFSYKHRHKFTLKVFLPRENPEVATVEGLWGVANWHEREAFDLFGIRFTGHSDMRRILLPDDWDGFPLRKDWQDPEFYNGMHVKPTQQMVDRALAGEKIGVGPFDFTPPNKHVQS
jgi:NADH-quinone oxidoreductase subunit C